MPTTQLGDETRPDNFKLGTSDTRTFGIMHDYRKQEKILSTQTIEGKITNLIQMYQALCYSPCEQISIYGSG